MVRILHCHYDEIYNVFGSHVYLDKNHEVRSWVINHAKQLKIKKEKNVVDSQT
jgi:hypothetical protein